MRFHKLISTLFHPIVIPTLGVILYFLLIPNRFGKQQQLAILGMVFLATYIIPLLLLVLLKALGQIKTYHVKSIKERKFPLAFMIILFYLLGNTFFNVTYVRDIGILFYATALGLIVIYILFITKLKTSLHLLSMGIALGFFLLLTTLYQKNLTPIILILVLLSGFVASSRLYLKAHKPKEVYIGFFLGLICPFLVNYLL